MISLLLAIAFLLGGAKNGVIEDYLRSQLIDYANFKYRVVNSQKFADKNWFIDYGREFTLKNHYGYIPIILKNGKYEERTFITVNLKLYRRTLVAVRKIRRGEKLFPADFETRISDVTKLRSEALTDYSQIENCRAKMNVREGAVVTRDMVEKTDDIAPGEKITAIYANGTVAVSFPAVARSGGKKGEIIRVQRKDGIIFKAKVLNKKQVTILE